MGIAWGNCRGRKAQVAVPSRPRGASAHKGRRVCCPRHGGRDDARAEVGRGREKIRLFSMS